MPEHCEVDENGSHGSGVGWGQKTDMLSWIQLSGTSQSVRGYFLQSPFKWGLSHLMSENFSFEKTVMIWMLVFMALPLWNEPDVGLSVGPFYVAWADRAAGIALAWKIWCICGSCLWLRAVAAVSVWTVILTLESIPPRTTIAVHASVQLTLDFCCIRFWLLDFIHLALATNSEQEGHCLPLGHFLDTSKNPICKGWLLLYEQCHSLFWNDKEIPVVACLLHLFNLVSC